MNRQEAIAEYREITADLVANYPQQGFENTVYEHIATFVSNNPEATYAEIIEETERFSRELVRGFEDYQEEVYNSRFIWDADRAWDRGPRVSFY